MSNRKREERKKGNFRSYEFFSFFVIHRNGAQGEHYRRSEWERKNDRTKMMKGFGNESRNKRTLQFPMFLFYYFCIFFVFTFLSTCLPVGLVSSLCLSISLAIFLPRIVRLVDAILGNVSTLLKLRAENARKENEPESEEESIHGMVVIFCIFLQPKFSASALGPI